MFVLSEFWIVKMQNHRGRIIILPQRIQIPLDLSLRFPNFWLWLSILGILWLETASLKSLPLSFHLLNKDIGHTGLKSL